MLVQNVHGLTTVIAFIFHDLSCSLAINHKAEASYAIVVKVPDVTTNEVLATENVGVSAESASIDGVFDGSVSVSIVDILAGIAANVSSVAISV